MTTEIAVLNRLGVALATDSAVTISGGGRTKVFDSADKLFELSCTLPIGIMVNGNMDCFGVPWEIVIKDFRSQHGETERPKISDWVADFLKFAENHKDLGANVAAAYTSHVASSEISVLKNRIMDAWWNPKNGVKRPSVVTDKEIREFSLDRISEIKELPKAFSLEDVDHNEIVEQNKELMNAMIKEQFLPLVIDQESIEQISIQIAHALLAMLPTDYATGLIVAGYGKDDTFPSLCSVDVEGYLFGKLKFSKIRDGVFIASKELGHVVSFAQTDVIERLLSGVDPRFIEESADFIRLSTEKIAIAIDKINKGRRNALQKNEIDTMITELADMTRGEYVEISRKLQSEFKQEFERMIAMMPKLEIIELAEALVSITAIERKATSDEGTVGGPIDVAFITKHEGFVWIKRKHYFEPALNPRYFWRKYNLGTKEA